MKAVAVNTCHINVSARTPGCCVRYRRLDGEYVLACTHNERHNDLLGKAMRRPGRTFAYVVMVAAPLARTYSGLVDLHLCMGVSFPTLRVTTRGPAVHFELEDPQSLSRNNRGCAQRFIRQRPGDRGGVILQNDGKVGD